MVYRLSDTNEAARREAVKQEMIDNYNRPTTHDRGEYPQP